MSLAFVLQMFVFTVLFGVLPALLFYLFRRFEGGKAFEQPVCGSCFYPVEQLPTRVCPECGSDLDDVGVLTHRRRRWWAVSGQVLTSGMLVAFGLGVAAQVLIPLLPVRVNRAWEVYLVPTDPALAHQFNIVGERMQWEKRNGESGSVREDPQRITYAFAGTAGPVVITASPGGTAPSGSHYVVVDLDTDTFTTVTPQRQNTSRGAFERERLIDWLESLPISLDDKQLEENASILLTFREDPRPVEAVAEQLNELWRTQQINQNVTIPLRYQGAGTTSNRVTDEIYLAIGGVLALLLWAWLAYRIIRGRRPESAKSPAAVAE